MKAFTRKLGYKLLSHIPRKPANHIFTTYFSKVDCGGPGRFMFNLSQAADVSDFKLHRYSISECQSALILSNSPGNYFFELCRNKNVKTVLRVDGFYLPLQHESQKNNHWSTQPDRALKETINQRMKKDLELSDWIIYQSNFSKSMCDSYLYRREHNFSIVYNGVDTEHFKPNTKESFSIPTLLILGTLRDPDFILCSLNCFKKFTKQTHSRIRIIGPMTPKVLEATQEWISSNEDLKDQIYYSNQNISFENLPGEINQCDIALHLKSGDWCPNAVLETLACGLPVVCPKFGGTQELVGDAGISLDMEPYSQNNNFPLLTSNAISEILTNLDSFKKRARERVENNFTIQLMISKYLEQLL